MSRFQGSDKLANERQQAIQKAPREAATLIGSGDLSFVQHSATTIAPRPPASRSLVGETKTKTDQ